MNILVINHYAGSPYYGMEFRPYYLAKYWLADGHRVKIVAASFSHLRTVNPKVDTRVANEIHDGINYTWVKTPEYQGNGLKRVINIFTFLIRLFANSKKIVFDFKPDLIITSSTYPLDSFLGVYYKWKIKCIQFHEVHDLWPLTLKEIGGFKWYHPFIVLLQLAENFAYKHSNAVISMLPNAKPYMVKHGLKEHFYHIPNGYFEKEWVDIVDLPIEHINLLTKLKQENKFIVMYAGGHAISNALDQFVDSAHSLNSRDDICFVLIGKGIEKESLQSKAQQYNLRNIYFLPPVLKNSIPNLLSFADCLYLGWHYSPLYEHGISPNKLIDYMLAGKPIIHAVCFSNDIVGEVGCGYSVKSGKIDEITNAILSLVEMSEDQRKVIGNKGREYAQRNNNYLILADTFLQIYKKYST